MVISQRITVKKKRDIESYLLTQASERNMLAEVTLVKVKPLHYVCLTIICHP